jgi:hypothetical protein
MTDVLSEISGSILRVELNRPAKKNAMSAAMYVAMADILNTTAKDNRVHAESKGSPSSVLRKTPGGLCASESGRRLMNRGKHVRA